MRKAVLVIVKDEDDKAYWAPYVRTVAELVGPVEIDGLPRALARMEESGGIPSLIIVSTRVYPEERPGLVEALGKRYPESEFLLVVSSSDPLPPLEPLARDSIRHLVINPEKQAFDMETGSSPVALAINRIAERTVPKVGDYLRPGTFVRELSVSSSEQKETIIAGLEELISGEDPEISLLRQKGALLADEMLENALYGAPIGENGLSLYNKGEKRMVSPREKIVFRYGFDGETLAVEVEDSWGSLSPRVVLEHLAKDPEDPAALDEDGGRGLYIIWRFLDHLHIHMQPGRQTVVGGQVKLITAEKIFDKKGAHITTGGIHHLASAC